MVIRATESFNLHCNNVARQVEEKCCPYYRTFNKVYTKLLKSLEYVFNGYPETLDDAVGLMYSVDLHLSKLLRTPVEDNGDPYIGPNAGPTFDFTPE